MPINIKRKKVKRKERLRKILKKQNMIGKENVGIGKENVEIGKDSAKRDKNGERKELLLLESLMRYW